jgi:hypothetical protein
MPIMFRTVLFGAAILATHAFAQDDAIPAGNAPSAFCHSLNYIKNFTASPPEFYSRDTPPEAARVSTGVICSQSNATDNSCEIPSGGFLELSKANNITGDLTTSLTNGTIARTIDWTIYSVTGDYNPYFGTSIGAVERRTLRFSPDASNNQNGNDTDVPKPGNNSDLDPTSAAYATFVPLYRCISGEFSDCPEGMGIENGTFLQVCYPETNSDAGEIENAPVLSGTTVVELTNVTYAASLTDNPHENLPEGLVLSGAWSGKSGSAASALLAAALTLDVLL